jgi:hypothetical protein
MTEEEAKTKWCPQTLCARLIVSDHVEQPVEMGGARCIGSACMAWRWKDRRAGHDLSHWTYFHPDDPERAQESHKEFLKSNPDGIDGFCGLAGRP